MFVIIDLCISLVYFVQTSDVNVVDGLVFMERLQDWGSQWQFLLCILQNVFYHLIAVAGVDAWFYCSILGCSGLSC